MLIATRVFGLVGLSRQPYRRQPVCGVREDGVDSVAWSGGCHQQRSGEKVTPLPQPCKKGKKRVAAMSGLVQQHV